MKLIKMTALLLTTGILLASVTACKKNEPDVTTGTTESSVETSVELVITSDTAQPPETEYIDGSAERVIFEGDEQTYANTFITNFVEQYFYTSFIFTEGENPGKFDVKTADIRDILFFDYYHIKLNNPDAFTGATKGECSYVTITFDKAAEVCGKYFSYMLSEESCKAMPVPPSTLEDQAFGPYYEDGKIWFVTGDGDSYRDIGIVDYAVNNGDGTLTLYFTIYCIDYETFESLDSDGLKAYYTLTPTQAQFDKTLTRRERGIANVSVGQSGKYYLNTYETVLDKMN